MESSQSKIKLFRLLQKPFGILGIFEPQKSQRHPFNWQNFVSLIFLGLYSASCGVFFLVEATTFRQYADAFYTSFSVGIPLFTCSTTISHVVQIYELIHGFEALIQKRLDNPTSKMIYEKTHKNVEKLSGSFYFALITISLPMANIPKGLFTVYAYFTTENGIYQLPFEMWTPYDHNNPLGYFIAWIFQCVSGYFLLTVFTVNLGHFTGSCKILTSISENIKVDLWALDKIIKQGGNPIELRTKLYEFIQFYSNAKELATTLSRIYKLIITAFFIWSIATNCSTLLMFQIELAQFNGDPNELIRLICLLFWSFAVIFFFCDYGEQVTSGFAETSDTIYQCDWYSFPIESQRLLPLIVMNSGKPVLIVGFGNMLCTREAFKKVTNVGFSYFTMLRHFGQ